jgi:MFS family permease
MLLGALFTVIAGWVVDRYGARIVLLIMGSLTGLSLLLTSQVRAVWQIFFTYSVLLSIGTGAAYVVIASTTSRWFTRRRGLALGVASAGGDIGTVALAPLAASLIAGYGWRWAYAILGIMAFSVVLPVSAFLRAPAATPAAKPAAKSAATPPADRSDIAQTREKGTAASAGLTLPAALRTRSFWLVFASFLFYAAPLLLLLTHLVPHATDIGFSTTQAAAILSITGAASIVGRILLGMASDRIGARLTLIVCVLVQSLAMLWLAFSAELWSMVLFALSYGATMGGSAPTAAALIGRIFGLKRIGAIMGVIDIGFGLGASIGPFLGGFIFDVTRSYNTAFLLSSAAFLISALLVVFVRQEYKN